VDACGGQPAFIGSTMIIEESHGACNVPITSVINSGGYVQVTLSSATTGVEVGDEVRVTAVGGVPGADGNSYVTGLSGAVLTLHKPWPGGTYTSGGTLTALFLKSGVSPQRYDIKVLAQSTMGSWTNPAIVDLTDTTGRSNLGIVSCSVGNPDGYTDGTTVYITFLVQDAGVGCSSSNPPSGGQYYGLWGCNLTTGGISSSNMTLSTCGPLVYSNQSGAGSGNAGAILDPHIHDGHIYISEVCYAWTSYKCSTKWPYWTIDDVDVSWSPGQPNPLPVVRYTFGNKWIPGSTQVTYSCTQFFKLTSVADLPSGTVRGFFNANQVGNDYGAIRVSGSPPFASSPFPGYPRFLDASAAWFRERSTRWPRIAGCRPPCELWRMHCGRRLW
jgi:hypothetical protein